MRYKMIVLILGYALKENTHHFAFDMNIFWPVK